MMVHSSYKEAVTKMYTKIRQQFLYCLPNSQKLFEMFMFSAQLTTLWLFSINPDIPA